MKKLLASFLSVTLFLGIPVQSAFAAMCVGICGRSAQSAILEINDYLNGENSSGADFVNSVLHEGLAKIAETVPAPALAEFVFTENPGSENSLSFTFIDSDSPENAYSYSTGGVISAKTNASPLLHGIFVIPMRMRDLTKHLLADDYALPFVDSLLGPDALVSASFRLAKNSSDSLIWTITLTDANTGRAYMVKTDAIAAGSPVFLVFRKR